MRHKAALLAVGMLLASCSRPTTPPEPQTSQLPTQPPPATKPVVLSIIATSDLHGFLERAVVFGGYLQNLKRVRATDGGVVLVDAGDMFQGTLAANMTEGAAVIRAYNALGYHAATIGNHEFDYGPVGPASTPSSPNDERRGALFAAASQARFPLLAANFQAKATGKLVAWPGVSPSTTIEVAGVKIGVVGVSTQGTLEATIAPNVDDLQMAPLAATVNQHARMLRQQGAQVVIATAHAGGECQRFNDPNDTSSCEKSELFELANALAPSSVNVLVGAHTHNAVAHRVNGVPVIQSWAYGRAFGRVDLRVNPNAGTVQVLRIHAPRRICQEADPNAPTCTPGEYEGAPVTPDDRVRGAVKDDLARAKAKREEPVGVAVAEDLSNEGDPSSPLGTLVATLMLETRPDSQVAIINEGGIRSNLPVGPLTYGTFYEMFPFDNRFAAANVKVADLRKLVVAHLSDGNRFSIAGVRVQARCEGQKLHVELLRQGRRLRDDDRVVLLMSDFLATTSRVSNAGIPRSAFSFDTGPAIREALLAYLSKSGRDLRAPAVSSIETPGSWPMVCP